MYSVLPIRGFFFAMHETLSLKIKNTLVTSVLPIRAVLRLSANQLL